MIELERIGFNYGTRTVLNDCSLTVADGAITTITGENGSGKSTIALLMAGMLQPVRGRIMVEGREMNDSREADGLRRSIGIVFENPDNQFITTSVERELAFGLENQGIEPAHIRERVDQAIERFSLSGIRDRAPHTLSGGEKQRVAIAATIIARPRYLILDEPTVFLDPASSRAIGHMVAGLRGETTIVLISQSAPEILLGERIYEIRGGRAEGPVDRASMFSSLQMSDPSIQFLNTLKQQGIFEGEDIPPVEALCAMLEARRKGR